MAKLELPGYPRGVVVPQPPFLRQVRPAQKTVLDVLGDALDDIGEKLFDDESTQRINGRYAAGQAVAHSKAFLDDWNDRYSGKEEDRAAALHEAIREQMGAVHQLALELGGQAGVVLEDVYTSRMFTVMDQAVEKAHQKIVAAQDAKIGLVRDELVRGALDSPYNLPDGLVASPEAFQEVADHFKDLTRGEHPKLSVTEARAGLTGTYRLIAEERVRRAIAANPDKWLTQLLEGQANSVRLPVADERFENSGIYTYSFDSEKMQSFVKYAGAMTDAYRIKGQVEDARNLEAYYKDGGQTVSDLAAGVMALQAKYGADPTPANREAALLGVDALENDFNEIAADPGLLRAMNLEPGHISNMQKIFDNARFEISSGQAIRGSQLEVKKMQAKIMQNPSLWGLRALRRQIDAPEYMAKVGQLGVLTLNETLDAAEYTRYPDLVKDVVEAAGRLTTGLGPGVAGEGREKLPFGAETPFEQILSDELTTMTQRPLFFQQHRDRGEIARAIAKKVGEVAETYATDLVDGDDVMEGQLAGLIETYKQSTEVIKQGMPFDAWLIQYVDAQGQPFSGDQLTRLLSRYEIWKSRVQQLFFEKLEAMRQHDADHPAPARRPTMEERQAAYGEGVPVYPAEKTRLGEEVDREEYLVAMGVGGDAYGLFVNAKGKTPDDLANALNVFLGGGYIEPGDITIKDHFAVGTARDPRPEQQYAVVSLDAVLESKAYTQLHPDDRGRLYAKLQAFRKALEAERWSHEPVKSWKQHAGAYFDETIQKAEQKAKEAHQVVVDAYKKERDEKLRSLGVGQNKRTADVEEKARLLRLKMEQLSEAERGQHAFTLRPDPDHPETFYDQAKGVVLAVDVLHAHEDGFAGVKQFIRTGAMADRVDPVIGQAIRKTAAAMGYKYLHDSRLHGGKITALVARNLNGRGQPASLAMQTEILQVLNDGAIHQLPRVLMDYINREHGDLLKKGRPFAGLSVAELEQELGGYVDGHIDTETARYRHIYKQGWSRDPDNRDRVPTDYREHLPTPELAEFSFHDRQAIQEFFKERRARKVDTVRSAAQVLQDMMKEEAARSVGGRD